MTRIYVVMKRYACGHGHGQPRNHEAYTDKKEAIERAKYLDKRAQQNEYWVDSIKFNPS